MGWTAKIAGFFGGSRGNPSLQDQINDLVLAQKWNSSQLTALGNRITDTQNRQAVLTGKVADLIKKLPHPPGPVARFIFKRIEDLIMDFAIGNNQYQDIAIGFADAGGNPTTEPNPLTFVTSDNLIATAGISPLDRTTLPPGTIPDTDVIIRVQSARNKIGTCQITVSDGTVTGVFNAVVSAGKVTSFTFTPLGTPQDLPAA